VYVLRSLDAAARCYMGSSGDLSRRLRQHNREISGGARYTAGRSWECVATVWHPRWTRGDALSLEMLAKRCGSVRALTRALLSWDRRLPDHDVFLDARAATPDPGLAEALLELRNACLSSARRASCDSTTE
jgi:predicted GIY-YIG superfamily endonuclease